MESGALHTPVGRVCWLPREVGAWKATISSMSRKSFVPHQRDHWSIYQFISAVGFILLLITGITIHRPLWHTEVNIGDEGYFITEGQSGKFYNLFSFYNPEVATWEAQERTFRWSNRRATVTFPFALHAQPSITTIVACGCRPGAHEVALVLNNQPITQLTTTADWRTYRILTPPTLEHPEYGLMVELRSPVWTAADGRDLGTALDRITIQQLLPEPIITPVVALGLILLSGLLLWRGVPHYLPLLLVTVAIVSGWAYQPTLLPLNLWQGTIILGLSGFWFIGAVRNWFIIMLTLCLSLWLGFAPQLLGMWVVDDAFISFQYARNFAAGNGLVFNPGEIVEGYTNFLWVILSALFFSWQIDPIIATSVLTLGLAYAYAGTAYLVARQIMPAGWSWGVALLVGCSNSFLIYSARGSGMETALFAWLNLLVLAALLHRAWYRAGIAATLTLLTRPDGIIVAVLGGGWILFSQGLQGVRQREVWQALGRYMLPLGLIFLPYYLWRWNYYGYPLPNTFYAKVGARLEQISQGISYLSQFALQERLPLFALAGVGVALWLYRLMPRAEQRFGLLLISFCGLFSSYVVVVGGDWMPGFRFGIPLVAPCAILSVWGCWQLARRLPSSIAPWRVSLLVGLLLAMVAVLPHDMSVNPNSNVWRETYGTRRHRETGRWIATYLPAETLVATMAAGAIPFYSQRTSIDILGLNDTFIAHQPTTNLGSGRTAHERREPDYVFSRNPDVIPWSSAHYFDNRIELERDYRLERFDGPEGQAVILYLRRDWDWLNTPCGRLLLERSSEPGADCTRAEEAYRYPYGR